jgi:glycerol-3-phosphate cytidylyltransferase-like family protein
VKKDKNYNNKEGSKIQKRESRKKLVFKFETVKEALKGLKEEMYTKHEDAEANFWLSGCEGHYRL